MLSRDLERLREERLTSLVTHLTQQFEEQRKRDEDLMRQLQQFADRLNELERLPSLLLLAAEVSHISRSRGRRRSPPCEAPMSSAGSARVPVSSRSTAPAAAPCQRSRPAGRSGSPSPCSPARQAPSTAHLPTARFLRALRAGLRRDAPVSFRSWCSCQISLSDNPLSRRRTGLHPSSESRHAIAH